MPDIYELCANCPVLFKIAADCDELKALPVLSTKTPLLSLAIREGMVSDLRGSNAATERVPIIMPLGFNATLEPLRPMILLFRSDPLWF
jgi:hypothetical protein